MAIWPRRRSGCGFFLFRFIGGGEGGAGAGSERDDELPGRLERQADRPIGGLGLWTCSLWNFAATGRW